MKKSFFQNFISFITAGFTAVIILSVLLCGYCLEPVHIENPEKNTDYVWEPGSHWMKLTEGFSYGAFDEKGYNNYSVEENPDIIILGSSHMEATNVLQKETLGCLLEKQFEGAHTVYNMGMSGHNFYKVCQYLPRSLELYAPEYAVIETDSVVVTSGNVEKVLTHTVEYTPSNNSGLVGLMQRVPFLRRMYRQYENGILDLLMPEKTPEIKRSDEFEEIIDSAAYDRLFSYLGEVQEASGTKLIIFYHPTGSLMADGSVDFRSSHANALAYFAACAEKQGIVFIDMTEEFERMVSEDHRLPHGFFTGKLESGHLNAYGHAAAAKLIYHTIGEIEENEGICQ